MNIEGQKRKYSVNDAVWIATALLAYEKHMIMPNAGRNDMYFKQADIVHRAQEIAEKNVDAARVSWWVNADNENATQNYLRADFEDNSSVRRLAKMDEFEEKSYPADLDMKDVVAVGDKEISLGDLFVFVKEDYPVLLEKCKASNIDYRRILEYLKYNRELPYADPEKPGLTEEQKQQYLTVKKNGQNIVAELKKIYELCRGKYRLTRCEKISWDDGTHKKTRKYLWVPMKYDKYADRRESISVFVEMITPEKPDYRVTLELRNDKAKSDEIRKYHRHLELPVNTEAGLVYVSGSNELGRPEMLNESQEIIKQKVDNNEYDKVQICKYIDADEHTTNEEIESGICSAIEALLPYYEYVIADEIKYWPSLEEYDPGITVEKWIELLNDSSVALDVNLRMFMMMLECGGESTCANLAEIYGGSAGAYNAWGSSFADRVHKATKCPLCMDGDRERVYTIAFVGRNVMEKGHDRYSWKLRDELKEALESDMINKKGIEQLKAFKEGLKKVQYAKNLILYGPPGTGKTYNSAIYAVAICDGKKVEELTDYDAVMSRYEELKEEGRIAFTTFHQSYGYEEFIEGIAPVIESDAAASDVMYKYKDGVFKEFCKKAAGTESTKKLNQITNSNPAVWKVSLKNTGDNEVRTECLENGHIRIGWDEYGKDVSAITEYTIGGKNILDAFVNKMQIGDIVVSCYSQTTIDAIGVITGEPEWGTYGDYNRVRKVEWIIEGINEDITAINKGKQLSDPTIHGLDMTESDIASFIEKIENAQNSKPYVFVIDEINRGNISKIFGELITLIEPTKRAGMPEAIDAKLPYTQKAFSVPANVYILGTMNTADRSIALMDTALRRRFQFIEMMPKADVLRKIGADKVEGLDVAVMLETINKRIEYLFDREHTIGHAFFTELKDEPTVEKLASIFKGAVIPLLQEYFYEDYSKIMLVLGDNGKTEDSQKFIIAKEIKPNQIFRGDTSDIDILDYAYEIQDEAFDNIMSYIEIMG